MVLFISATTGEMELVFNAEERSTLNWSEIGRSFTPVQQLFCIYFAFSFKIGVFTYQAEPLQLVMEKFL